MTDIFHTQYPGTPKEYPRPELPPETPGSPIPDTPVLPPDKPLIIPEEHPVTNDPPVEIPEKEE